MGRSERLGLNTAKIELAPIQWPIVIDQAASDALDGYCYGATLGKSNQLVG